MTIAQICPHHRAKTMPLALTKKFLKSSAARVDTTGCANATNPMSRDQDSPQLPEIQTVLPPSSELTRNFAKGVAA